MVISVVVLATGAQVVAAYADVLAALHIASRRIVYGYRPGRSRSPQDGHYASSQECPIFHVSSPSTGISGQLTMPSLRQTGSSATYLSACLINPDSAPELRHAAGV